MSESSGREFRSFKFRDLRTYQFPTPTNDLITEGILKHDSLLEVIGQAKSYKSFLLNTIAIDLITGRNLFAAHRTLGTDRYSKAFEVRKPCRVLYIEQEIGAQDLRERLLILYDSLSAVERGQMDENLITHSFDHSLTLDTDAGKTKLRSLVASAKPNVLILDPLVEFHTSNENDTQGMSKVARTFDQLREAFHPLAIIFSHHEGHPSMLSRTNIGRGRGSSVIPGKIDTAMNVNVRNRTAKELQVDITLRRGKPIDSFFIRLNGGLRADFICWQKDPKKKAKLTPPEVEEMTGLTQ